MLIHDVMMMFEKDCGPIVVVVAVVVVVVAVLVTVLVQIMNETDLAIAIGNDD